MASTRTLLQTVQWAQTMSEMVPIIGVGGFNDEPALTICNNVLQEMGSPPYNWKFNSVDSTGFYTVATTSPGATIVPFVTPACPNPATTVAPFCIPTQDYAHVYSDIGWIEAAYIVDVYSTALLQPSTDITAVQTLRKSTEVGTPRKIANMYPNDAGGIFRLWPVPSLGNQLQVFVTYQRKFTLRTGLAETWAPFPDEMSWVINKGFLAEAYRHANDARFTAAYAEFQVAMRKSIGLDDAEANDDGFVPDFGLFMG